MTYLYLLSTIPLAASLFLELPMVMPLIAERTSAVFRGLVLMLRYTSEGGGTAGSSGFG